MASMTSWPSAVLPSESSTRWAPSVPAPPRTRVARTPSRRRDTVPAQALGKELGGAWMVAIVEVVARMDDRDRHSVAGIHLAELHAGGAAAEDEQRAGKDPRAGALPIRPRCDLVEARQVRDA